MSQGVLPISFVEKATNNKQQEELPLYLMAWTLGVKSISSLFARWHALFVPFDDSQREDKGNTQKGILLYLACFTADAE